MKNKSYHGLSWGISTLGCPEYPLDKAVRLADQFGIRFLELRFLSGSAALAETLQLPENRNAMRRLAESGRCRVFGSAFHAALDSIEERNELCAIARCADEFNVPYIRVFGGFPFQEELTPERLSRSVENFRWFDSQNFHVRLALETHDGYSASSRCLKLAEALGGDLPIIWDAHHTWRFAGEGFQESFGLLKDFLVDIHFKDSHAVPGPPGAHLGDLPGEGELPLHELFTLLAREHCALPVTLEYEKVWMPYLPELPVALKVWKKHFLNNGDF